MIYRNYTYIEREREMYINIVVAYKLPHVLSGAGMCRFNTSLEKS